MNQSSGIKWNRVLLLMLMALVGPGIYAQDRVMNYAEDPLVVDGQAQNPTDEELEYIRNELDKQSDQIMLNNQKSDKYRRLQRTTEKLAKTTERYVNEKSNSEKKINEYNKKIDCLLNDSTDPECDQFREDKVSHTQAAPQVQAKAKRDFDYVEKIRITPYAFATSYSGNGLNNIESNPGFGLRLDADLNKSFAMGVGVSMMSMQSNDLRCFGSFGMNCFPTAGAYPMHGFGHGYAATPFNSGLNQMGRSVDIDNFAIDLLGRYNIAIREQFVPYVGFGISYNRISLEFSDQIHGSNFGMMSPFAMGHTGWNSKYDTTFFSARIATGADYYFTDMFGINLEFSYSRGLVNPNDRTNTPGFHRMLEEIGDQIAGANAMSAQLGVIIAF